MPRAFSGPVRNENETDTPARTNPTTRHNDPDAIALNANHRRAPGVAGTPAQLRGAAKTS